MRDQVEELLDYFRLLNGQEEAIEIEVYKSGRYVKGIIDDELLGILLSLREAYDETE